MKRNTSNEMKVDTPHNMSSERGRRYRVPISTSIWSNLPPPKTTLAAIIFFVFGFSFLISGIVIYFTSTKSEKGITFILLGGLMFLPGSYASYILLGTFLGWEDFSYSQIPSYDD